MAEIYFDADGFNLALQSEIKKIANKEIKNFRSEAMQGLSSKAKSTIHFAKSDEVSNFITSYCEFSAQAIIESYGTGSEMDTGNKFLKEYQNGELWNPARKGLPIVGRPAGKYKNIFGKTASSSGAKVGQNIEDYYEPLIPTYSIQSAEKWLMNDSETRIERELSVALQKFYDNNFDKYLRTVW